MSTAEHFQYPGKFPACVPAGSPASDDIKIVDLELADAMRLFWCVESIALSIQLIAHDGGGGASTILEAIGVEIPAVGETPLAPRERCCLSNVPEGEPGILTSTFLATPLLLPAAYAYPGIGGSTITEDFTLDEIYFFREIYQQEDGYFTIVFWNEPSISARDFYISGSNVPVDGYVYTGIYDEQDLTDAHPELGSGRIPYYMHKISGDDLFEADSASFSLQFTFFTFS